jgi:CRP-like cAMP-binding protein
LTEGQVVQQEKTVATHLHFVERGVASMVINSRAGAQVESGVAGCESAIGTTSLLTGESCFQRVVVQIPGNAYRIPIEIIRSEYAINTTLQKMLLLSAHLDMVQSSQTAMCNRVHSVEERLGRWILTVQDRLESNRLNITHEMIAQMLGARRSGVTAALGALQHNGSIGLARGYITVLDAGKLEACSCECYRVLHEQFRRIHKFMPA